MRQLTSDPEILLLRENGSLVGTVALAFEGDIAAVREFEASLEGTERVILQNLGDPSIVFTSSGVLGFSGSLEGKGFALVPPNTLMFLPTGTKIMGMASEGEHRWQVLSWHPGSAPPLDRYIEAWVRKGSSDIGIASASIAGLDSDSECGMDRLVRLDYPRADFELLSCIVSLVPQLLSGDNRVHVAPIVKGLPDQIQSLADEVVTDSARPWPLPEAASFAGYSSFHFSRMFKQLVGCGFHEFVDRCRTERAVEMLSEGDLDASKIWSLAGFPSLRAMRESVRDYLGLTLTDLTKLRDASRLERR